MKLKKIKNKKAAIELSIGTVVIIVLAMTMLILGLVLVRNIFKGATDSVDTLNDKVKTEITNIFAEGGSKIAIRLGADKIAKVESGTDGFGIAVGAQTRDGSAVDNTNLKYYLEYTNDLSHGDCNGIEILDHSFTARRSGTYQFEDTSGENGYVRLVFNIEEGAPECTQRIKIYTRDTDTDDIASASFRVQIISGGIFS